MTFVLNEKKKIAIVGLGISGLSLAKNLKKYDLELICWDDNPQKRLLAKKVGLNLSKVQKIDYDKIDYLILSPGIPHYGSGQHLCAKLAKDSKCKIISEIEFLKFLKTKVTLIGVTGTNGKTTTTKCLEHILNNNNIRSYACGNVGHPYTEINIKKNDTLILEASSFQLERTIDLKFDISILLNISEDHLERHLNMDNYIKAKLKIFRNQKINDAAIICIDDRICNLIAKEFKSKFLSNLIKISIKQTIEDGIFIKEIRKKKFIINNIDNSKLKIPDAYTNNHVGGHNLQNLLATYACCNILKISNESFLAGLDKFKGLEHRLELFAKYKNICFYNDSKATNYQSAKVAISNIPNIFWILGGRAKKNGILGIEENLTNVKKAFTFGESSEIFFNYLRKFVKAKKFNTLENALNEAFNSAKKSNKKINILLSPACSSFDQFDNFEARGKYFKQIVFKLINDN